MRLRGRLALPAIAALIVAGPLAGCGGDDTPDTPTATTAPAATSPGSVVTGDTMTDDTTENGATVTTLGGDNPATEGDTGNGTGNSSTPGSMP